MSNNERIIYLAIREWFENNYYAPTNRELASICNLSLSTINKYLKILKEKKLIDYTEYLSRTIKLLERVFTDL